MKSILIDEIESAMSQMIPASEQARRNRIASQRLSRVISAIESEQETEHSTLAHPVESCFCDACCEKRFDTETRTIRTKLRRNGGF